MAGIRATHLRHELELNKSGHPDEAHGMVRLGKDAPMIYLELQDTYGAFPMSVEMSPEETKQLISMLVGLL